MMGMVFTSFVEMVEADFSPELADDILSAAQLPHGGAYTAVGYYPFDEMQALLGLLAQRTGKAPAALLEHFGRHLFNDIHRGHSDMILCMSSLFELLEGLDRHIHREVHKLYPDAQLPKFDVVSQSGDHMRLRYRSPRQLEALAVGLIHGAAAAFGTPVDVTVQPSDEDGVFIDVRMCA